MALQTQPCRHSGARHTVLPCPSLGNHPLFPHVLSQKRLTDGVVHLMGARMIQVFSLQEDPPAADMVGEPRRFIQWRGASDVVR